jgi:Tol biopolymer transport system component
MRALIGPVIMGALCSCSAQDALGPQPETSRQIAFTAFPANAQLGSLALIRSDGSHLRVLPLNAFAPAFSPDGKLMAAVGDTGLSLLVMNADGSHPRTILRWRLMSEPAWSPDGSQLAFMCSDSIPGYSTNICVVSVNGGTMRRITHRELEANSPTWSPDGHLVAFACSPGGYLYSDPTNPNPPEPFTPAHAHGICIANADGSGWRQLTTAADYEPRWSWRANEIVALRDFQLLTIISPDGDTVRTLSIPTFSAVTAAAWSPDGHTLAFVGEKRKLEGDAVMQLDFDSIYLINVDGSGLTRLTNGLDAEEPAWSP